MTTITIDRAVVEQALEALEAIREADTAGATPKMVIEARSMYEPTITALRAALAQAEPMTPADRIEAEADRRGRALAAEMRAALAQEQAEQTWVCPDSPEHRYAKPGHCEDCGKTLVLAHEQAEPVQEPVAWIDALKDAFFEGFTSVATYNDTLLNSPEEAWGNYKLPHTNPPQRPRLTDEEIDRIDQSIPRDTELRTGKRLFARAVERAHGIGGSNG